MSNLSSQQNPESGQSNQSTRHFAARRSFLTYSVFAGAAALLAACGGESNSGAEGGGNACAETTSLSLAQRANRTALQYVDVSDNPEETCDNCRYFEQLEDGSMCGTCTVVSGPIALEGYCTAWASL